MRVEVEQKIPVADLAILTAKLAVLGAAAGEPQVEIDLYYQHPARDFAATDEALRIRRVGRAAYLTYKGPKLDATTKTRREIDLPLAEGTDAEEGWPGLLAALGFTPIAEVRKRRRKAHVSWQARRIEVSLDEVDKVGTFVELEVVASAEDVASAKACIADLAAYLGLSGSERRSYLELLLEQHGRAPSPSPQR